MHTAMEALRGKAEKIDTYLESKNLDFRANT